MTFVFCRALTGEAGAAATGISGAWSRARPALHDSNLAEPSGSGRLMFVVNAMLGLATHGGEEARAQLRASGVVSLVYSLLSSRDPQSRCAGASLTRCLAWDRAGRLALRCRGLEQALMEVSMPRLPPCYLQLCRGGFPGSPVMRYLP